MTKRTITPSSTRVLLVTSAILDAVILAIFLFMPRSGMEAMFAAGA